MNIDNRLLRLQLSFSFCLSHTVPPLSHGELSHDQTSPPVIKDQRQHYHFPCIVIEATEM